MRIRKSLIFGATIFICSLVYFAPASIIQKLKSKGVTVVVIEHDMAFIRDLNATTSVLHYGQLFAQGSFSEIEQNDEVRRIYMGTL